VNEDHKHNDIIFIVFIFLFHYYYYYFKKFIALCFRSLEGGGRKNQKIQKAVPLQQSTNSVGGLERGRGEK
jgi:hypothetical protein